MKEKTILRVIQTLCIVSLIITVFSIQRTYAKYFEKVGTTYETDIKRWVINVNDVNIHGKNDELTRVMRPQFRADPKVNDNVLVPGREGYFEFIIDYTKVDLAFKCDFDFKQLNKKIGTDGETEVDNFLEDFEIYGYSIIEIETDSGKEIEKITTLETVNDLSGLTQIIDPTTTNSKGEKELCFRVLFRWNDENMDTAEFDDANGMNNYEDTQYAGNAIIGDNVHTSFDYRVKVTFTQYLEVSN